MRMPDPSKYRKKDTAYLRKLLADNGLSQRKAAGLIGVEERTMRLWCAGKAAFPYAAQFILEEMLEEKKEVITPPPQTAPLAESAAPISD